MIEINLRDTLNESQFYVVELSEEFGIKIKALRHEISTKTCYEKANLLGWDAGRVVKTLYFHDPFYEYFIGVITPETGKKLNLEKIIPEVLPDVSLRRANGFYLDGMPEGMTRGTCTPFPYKSSMEKEIDLLIIKNVPELDKQDVDISVGGFEEEAFRTSIHLPYSAIYEILHHKFKDKIKKINF